MYILSSIDVMAWSVLGDGKSPVQESVKSVQVVLKGSNWCKSLSMAVEPKNSDEYLSQNMTSTHEILAAIEMDYADPLPPLPCPPCTKSLPFDQTIPWFRLGDGGAPLKRLEGPTQDLFFADSTSTKLK
jgi:hypothetical protein